MSPSNSFARGPSRRSSRASGSLVDVRIVPMRPEHLDRVAAIEAETSSRPWSRELFAGELDAGQPYFVATFDRVQDAGDLPLLPASLNGEISGGVSELIGRLDDPVLGFIGVIQMADEAHITNVAIDERFRRCGLATRMMITAVKELRRRGVVDITLEVRASNEPALSLYRAFGFAPEGVRVGYYADPREDALILWVRNINSTRFGQRIEQLEHRLESSDPTAQSTALMSPGAT